MMKSMTGYGEFENKNDYVHIYVEIKSFNSRYFEFQSRSSKILSLYEGEVKNKIKSNCKRGSFQFRAKVIIENDNQPLVDENKIKNYIDVADKIQKISNNKLDKLSIDKIISLPDIYVIKDINSSLIKDLYLDTISSAIIELNRSRLNEGQNIEKELKKNLKNLYKSFKIISKLSKTTMKKEFDKYKNKITQLIDGLEIKEDRLYQEVAIMIDKQDIEEELVRMDSHLKTLEEYFSRDDEVGKKINFILQEANREINTISSKSSNINIVNEVLNMKNEVEKIREQVQNIL